LLHSFPTRRSSDLAPDRGTMLFEVRDDRALHLFVSGDQAARVRLQTLAQKCGRPTHATEIARVELAKVIVGRRRCRAVRGAHERQQVGAPKPSLAPPADAETRQLPRVGPATQ